MELRLYGLIAYLLLSAAPPLLGAAVALAGQPELCGNTESEETEVDTRRPNESMEGIPVLDQDGTALCYSYATSVMMSAWLRSHADPQMTEEERHKLIISPLITGLASFDAQYKTAGCEMGSPCSVADFLKKYGSCSLDQVVQSVGGSRRLLDAPEVVMDRCVRWEAGGSLDSLLKDIKARVQEAKALVTSIRKEEQYGIAGVFGAENGKWSTSPNWIKLRDSSVQGLLDQFEGGSFPDIAEYYGVADTPSRAAMLTFAPDCFDLKRIEKNEGQPTFNFSYHGNFHMGQPIAPGRPKVPNFSTCKAEQTFGDSCIPTQQKAPKDFLRSLNQHFDTKKPQPVVVSYCWTFLVEGAKRVPEEFIENLGGIRGNCFRHTESAKIEPTVDHKSVIIGRRLNPKTKSCEFLLRNSWGNDCNSYSSPDKGENFPDLAASCQEQLQEHHAADIWVPADLLTNNMFGMSKLE